MNDNKSVREPKQRRSMQKKQLVIDTARELFCKTGYYNTTTNEIAKAAGVSIGTLYSYFTDKERILLELLGQYNDYFYRSFEFIDTQENAMLFKENPHLWFRMLIENLIRVHEPQAAFHQELEVLYYSMPEVAAVMDAQTERVRLAALKIIKEYQEDPAAKMIKAVCSDLEAASVIAVDFINALVDRVVFKEHPIGQERIIDAGAEAVYRIFIVE